jgi:predicted RNase H-like nuclease (RuvC/YqgF family)
MQSAASLFEKHLAQLKIKMEENRQLLEENLNLQKALQAEQEKNRELDAELKSLRKLRTVDNRAVALSSANGSKQTKAWIDRLVQEIDTCLETLNR